MKKLSLAFFLGIFLIGACDEEALNPEYPFKIVVKTQEDSTRAQNTFVEVLAPINGNTVWLSGYTDEAGEVEFEYDNAATLSVRASRGKRPDYTWIGCTEIRLIPNEQIVKTVYIEPFDTLLVGCSFDR